MRFTSATLLSILLAAASVNAVPAADAKDLFRRTPPQGECGRRFGAPIAAYKAGSRCDGTGYACSLDCKEVIQCANGKFHKIAACHGATCAGNHNNGAVCH